MGLSNIVHNLMPNFGRMAKSSVKTFSAYASALLLAVAPVSCGSEEQEVRRGCVSNTDCKVERVCIDGLCQTARFYDPQPEEPRHEEVPSPRCVEQIDVCDGIDNNCNSVVDELGCGRIYAYDWWDTAAGADPFGQFIYIDLHDFSRHELTSNSLLGLASSSLSPDKSSIAYISDVGLHILHLEDEQRRVILRNEDHIRMENNCMGTGIASFGPSYRWFPDNFHISYVRYVRCRDEDEHYAGLFSVQIDGGNEKLITMVRGSEGEGILWHSVSPNGEWIAFCGVPPEEYQRYGGENNTELYVIKSDGTGSPRRLTHHDDDVYFTIWKGNNTIFSRFAGNGLYSVSLDGSNPQPELEDGVYPTFNSNYSKALVLYTDDMPWAVWDVTSKEVVDISKPLFDIFEHRIYPLAWTE